MVLWTPIPWQSSTAFYYSCTSRCWMPSLVWSTCLPLSPEFEDLTLRHSPVSDGFPPQQTGCGVIPCDLELLKSRVPWSKVESSGPYSHNHLATKKLGLWHTPKHWGTTFFLSHRPLLRARAWVNQWTRLSWARAHREAEITAFTSEGQRIISRLWLTVDQSNCFPKKPMCEHIGDVWRSLDLLSNTDRSWRIDVCGRRTLIHLALSKTHSSTFCMHLCAFFSFRGPWKGMPLSVPLASSSLELLCKHLLSSRPREPWKPAESDPGAVRCSSHPSRKRPSIVRGVWVDTRRLVPDGLPT